MDPLIDRIIKWILARNIPIPLPLNMGYFTPCLYSKEQSNQLIKKGYNPKVFLYMFNDEKQATFNYQLKLMGYHTSGYKLAIEDFWFSFEDLKCGTSCCADCPDTKKKFLYSAGFRVDKKKKIGQGGFGTVYEGKIHDEDIAAKFIDVTAKYRALVDPSGVERPGVGLDALVRDLFGDLAYEASAQRKFDHDHILSSNEWWFQCSTRNLIELVISTPKCYSNLQEWVEKEPFNFDQNCRFLVETSEALEYLAEQNLAHKDVKPGNILITGRLNPIAKLTDFGLMKHDGVTPVFCSPEQLVKNGTVIEKTDVHGLGVTTMVTFFEQADAIKILFGVTKSVTPSEIENAQSDPVLTLVASMIQFDPSARPSLLTVRKLLRKLPVMAARKTLATMGLILPTKKKDLVRILNLSFKGLALYNLSIMPSIQPHRSIISGSVHDQMQSGLCWAFCFASLIRGELKRLIRKLSAAGWITDEVAARALLEADTLNLQNRLMNELVCLVVPRNPKLDNLNSTEAMNQVSSGDCIEKICSEALLRPAGWTRLPSVRRITDQLIQKGTDQYGMKY